jgi:hypothetical protein
MNESTIDLRILRGGAAVIGGVAAAWPLLPHPPLCPLLSLTGVPCPLCGATRSVVALLRGDLGASVRFSPIGVLVVALVAYALVAWRRKQITIPTIPIVAMLGLLWAWNLTLNPTFN